MQAIVQRLRRLMERRGLSQMQLARLAHVSQSTVSRILNGERRNHGQAHRKLLTYVQSQKEVEDRPMADGVERVTTAFKRIWDGSGAHATAIVSVIHALAGLKPTRGQKRGRKRERHS